MIKVNNAIKPVIVIGNDKFIQLCTIMLLR